MPSIRRSDLVYLNITQFLGVLNDNLYKLLMIFLLIHVEGEAKSSVILSLAGGVFVLPFLLFTPFAGGLADKYSKRNIIIGCKFLEIIVMGLAALTFYLQSPIGCYTVLFLMAMQSALFAPSKYGIIPEIVGAKQIVKANGLITSLTFIAVIMGSFLASFIAERLDGHYVYAGLLCILIAIVGFVTSTRIHPLTPTHSPEKISPFFLREIHRTLLDSAKYKNLFIAIIGSAVFLFIGSYVQLNIIPYSIHSLGLTNTQGGYLFSVTAIGIGGGSLIAGKVIGRYGNLSSTVVGGIGVSFCLLLLNLLPYTLYSAIPLLFFLGLAGSFFIVPFDSFIQIVTPRKKIGKYVAASTFLAFVGVLLSAVFLYLVNDMLQVSASRGFLIVGSLTLLMTLIISYFILNHLVPTLCHFYARARYQIEVEGTNILTEEKHKLVICLSNHWKNLFFFWAIEKRPTRIVIETDRKNFRLLRPFSRALNLFIIDKFPPEENDSYFSQIFASLEEGESILFLTNRPTSEIQHHQSLFEKQLSHPMMLIEMNVDQTSLPLINVTLHKRSE
ncbi:MFS transporter [Simkania negevensis]|uniref:MFS transporter n=1 Tax=Simkania negevensis TaxID=83561 RepID=A0ABS3AV01_9BACT|nr:MFS transporter [Simkania negevensis]